MCASGTFAEMLHRLPGAEFIGGGGFKKLQGGRPNLLDHMANDDLQLNFSTPSGKGARTDEGKIRAATAAVMHGIFCVTTVPGCLGVPADELINRSNSSDGSKFADGLCDP